MFRPEIQSLRAIAVLAVVGYHLWPDRLTGGYVGVDVFFVVSGFLITGHLAAEVAGSGRLGLGRFWARRIRRLVPAASVVLLACFALMLTVVPHSLWQRTVVEIGASALDIQNWVLAANSVDYLGADGSATLVQHYWSLSVEEQFYLAWPLLIVVAVVVFRRVPVRRKLLIALGAVFVVSLGYSVIEAVRGEPSAYFNTGTRAWEFAAGGLLALAPVALPRAASWGGLLVIAVTVFAFTPSTPFPSAWALLPVLGALLVIAGGRNRVLEARPLQVVGGLSYSLYLWHWPLVVALPYALGRELGLGDKVGLLVVAVLLAALTKRFVEDPVRRAPRLAHPVGTYALALVTVGVLVIAASTTWFSVRSAASAAAHTVANAEQGECFGASALVEQCDRPFAVPADFDAAFWAADVGTLGSCNSVGVAVERCSFGDTTDPDLTIALIGNSHAGHLVAALDAYGAEHHWKIELMRKTGCTGATTEAVLEASKQPCVDWSRNVTAAVLDPANGIDAAVYASNNDGVHYVADRSLSAPETAAVAGQIAQNLESIEAAGKRVIVLGDVPGAIPEVVPECVDEHAGTYDPCATPRAAGLEKDDIVAQAARLAPGVGFIDLLPFFCDAASCHVMIGGALVYLDQHHLTATFSRSLAPYLGGALAMEIQG